MSGLPPGETQFVIGVSEKTRLDPRVLVSWIQSEGNPGPQGNNWLNIQTATAKSLGVPTVGTLAAGTAAFADVATGIKATVAEITKLGLGNEQGKTPGAAIADIAASRWASSHYGGPGGPNLRNTFASIFTSAGLSSPYATPDKGGALAVAETVGTGSAADAGSVDITGSGGGPSVAGAVSGGLFGGLESWLTSTGKLVLAYVLLVGVAGALFVTGLKGLGVPVPKTVPVPA